MTSKDYTTDTKSTAGQVPAAQAASAAEPAHAVIIQRKLAIGAADDPLEAEADAVADRVMRMPEQPLIQRKCTDCEEEEKVQRRPEQSFIQRTCTACEEDKVQMKTLASSVTPFIQASGNGGGGMAGEAVSSRISASRGSGSSIDTSTRSFMESRFGTDFSAVKIHTGSEAVQLSRELNAQAFTVGNDIYFNEGKYNPVTGSGKHLLAHELTHTIQQGGSSTKDTVRASSAQKGIQRSMTNICNAPSHWGMAPSLWYLIGTFAHLLGMGDYIARTGGTRGMDIYLDTFELLPIDPDYAAFIIRNNPGIASWKQVFLSVTPLKRPDYMIHRPAMTEFDELKPYSIPGVADGVAKIYEIAAYMTALGLPYRFGTSYTPTRYIPLFSTTVAGVPVNVSLKFERLRSGLIVYELCIETDWALVAKAAVVAAVIALLIILLRRLPIPGPAPAPALAMSGGENDNNAAPAAVPDFTLSPELSRIV